MISNYDQTQIYSYMLFVISYVHMCLSIMLFIYVYDTMIKHKLC